MKKNKDVGETKPQCGQLEFIKKGYIAGKPGYKKDEEGVKELFY